MLQVVTGVIVFTLVHFAASLVVILHYIEAKEEQFASEMRLMGVVAGAQLHLASYVGLVPITRLI